MLNAIFNTAQNIRDILEAERKAIEEIDLAHQRDMERLRKEQLRQEDFDPEEIDFAQDVEDAFWRDFDRSDEGAEDFPF